MASDDLSSLPSSDDEKYGFQRPEMFSIKLAGTVDAYDRHVFLCYKSPEAWPARVEGSESDPLPKLLSSAFKARKNDISVKTKLTVCEGREGTDFADGDVLIFPDMIKYRGLKESDVDSFVDDVIVNGKPWASGAQEVLTGSHVFVCAHGSRDRRCGVCGPVLIDKFIEEAELRGMKDKVFVSPCSHIGGHKYAGNLIIYSPGVDGMITGHWYGYVAPDDVPELLDEHIGKGQIIERLWRGQMGVSAEEIEKALEHKVPNGESEKLKDQKLPNGEDSKKSEEKPQENFAGCCQGANGVSCCRDGSLEQTSGIEEKKQKETTEATSGKKDGLACKLTSCIGKWEQSDILAAVAVVGAVATVGVAVYSFHRRYKNQNVAVKIVNRGETPEEIAKREARFAREVAMLSRVQHKNLVKFIGACKEPVMVIVTELLLGGTLRKYLFSMRPRCLDMPVAVGFALDIARAMECLHSHGIIHRDLKPENLILTADHKTVKLADFGLAREESLTEMMTAETGTYRWMAPELYSTVTLRHGEKKHYNHKVDAYSFAIVLWELIHNKLPFEGMSNLQAAYAAAFKNVRPSAEDLPEDLALIVTSCWKEDPNDRPNFSQIIQMLLHYLSTIAPTKPAIPQRIFRSDNAVLPPESPGTSSLMATHDESGETPKADMQEKPKGFFFCFNQCC